MVLDLMIQRTMNENCLSLCVVSVYRIALYVSFNKIALVEYLVALHLSIVPLYGEFIKELYI